MKCSCPKCSARLPEDLSSIPEKGKSGKCPECSGSYWIHRESFILRCYAVTGERYCNRCGEGLGPSTYCPGCGTLYPDYCIVHSKKPAQRAFAKTKFSFNLSLPSPSKKSVSAREKEGLTVAAGKVKGSSNLRSQLLKVGVVIALLAAVTVIGFLYLQDRAEKKFSKHFVAVLYGIKSGTDQCMKLSALLASGSPLANKDLALLKTVHTENTAALQTLSPPPKKFSEVHSRLVQLAATYDKLHNLCISSAPIMAVATSAEALESQFNAQAKALRAVLPPKLSAEIKDKSTRLTNLQFMLQ